MTFGKVSIPILHTSPQYNKYLSPLHQPFKWALKKLIPLVHEEIPATSADELAAVDPQTAPVEEQEIPQPEEPELAIPEVVMQLTDTPLPKPKNPFSSKQKFKAEDFFAEHVFFTDYNPYDSARIRKRRF